MFLLISYTYQKPYNISNLKVLLISMKFQFCKKEKNLKKKGSIIFSVGNENY